MRQYKFRGKWIYGDNQWVYGGIVSNEEHVSITTYDTMYEVIPSTVGQFTGLLDRNGKEVYEGDILVYIDRDANEHYREVVYHQGCFKLHNPYVRLTDTPICHHLVNGELYWEIFGNIHEQSKS